MFPFNTFPKASRGRANPSTPFEPLEGRQLLSTTPACAPAGPGGGGPPADTIAFSLAPAAVQTGLTTLATTDGLTAPTTTTDVALGNRDGVETYSVTISSTGTVSTLTVNAAGTPVTAPTQSTTTFGALATAPAAEITAIATAKSLTAPTASTVVNVTTTAAGAVTYSVALTGDGSATPVTSTAAVNPGTIMFVSPPDGGFAVTVDAAGDPGGDQQLPFSVFSTTIQNALNAGAPTGATALAATSTQTVAVKTSDGITTYATTFDVSGTDTTVTVDAAGAAVTPASKATVDFSTIPAAAQTELQALATAKGYTGTIATTQSVTAYTETGGATTLYAVTLGVTDTTTTRVSTTDTHDVTFVSDASGNPTTLDMGDAGPGSAGGSPGDPGGHREGGGPGGGGDWNGGPPSDGSGSTTTGSAGGTASSTVSKASSTAVSSASAAGAIATVLSIDTAATPTLGASLTLFASALTNATVLADLVTLRTDAATLKATVKGLSKANAATLKADEKGISAAVKAIGAPLTAAEKTLKTDTAKQSAVLKADQKAIRKDAKNATALSADKAKLSTDESSAYAALSADLDALKALIAADAGVTAAESKLSTDLPTVASEQSTVVSAYGQLQVDIGTALAAEAT
jgi:hypothetical protein